MQLSRISLLFALIGVKSFAIAQSTQPTTAEQERQQEIRQLEAETARLPTLRVDTPSQLVNFKIEDDMLVAGAIATPNAAESHVIAPGLAGVIRLKWYSPRAFIPSDAPSQDFQLLQQDLTDPQQGHVNTMVSAVAGRVLVSRDAENETSLSSIQYVQDPPLAAFGPDQDFVRLLVSRSDSNDKSRDLNLKLSAKTFMELRLKHPREVDLYFRPIVRSFGSEPAVFAVPSSLAWQVLGTEAGADPQLRTQIDGIIVRLGADEYRQRQSAMNELKQLGQPAVVVLSKLDRSKLSLQQNTEIDSFLAGASPSKAQVSNELGGDPGFLLDMLYTDEPALRAAALKRLSDITGKPIQFDGSLGAEQRSESIAKLRAQFAPTTQP